MKKTLIVLVGPTGVGKSAMALILAEALKTEIISADARQVFMEMSIGTSRPSAKDLLKVKHHFVASHSIHDEINSGRFAEEASSLITNLFKAQDCLLLCGGSGLYIKALLEGFDKMPGVPSQIREQIVTKYQLHGIGFLQNELAVRDPDYFQAVDRNNPQRLMRALEVIEATGKPFSSFHTQKKSALSCEIIKVGLNLPRKELYLQIDERMEKMIGEGLFVEAGELYPYRHLNALQTVGYKEIFDFMEGKYDQLEAIRLLKRNSRNYAKRQITWFRKDTGIKWFEPHETDSVIEFINKMISQSA